jgi:small GTP-binding protein
VHVGKPITAAVIVETTITAAVDVKKTITAAANDQKRSRRLPAWRPRTLLSTTSRTRLVVSLQFCGESVIELNSVSVDMTEASFKIVIVGAAGVGKSSVITRLIHGKFNPDGSPTCGADFWTWTCRLNDATTRLQIWDTAGQERFRSISKSYFRNAAGALLVYDITSLRSFDALGSWLLELHTLSLPNSFVLLVGNKCDLAAERQVGQEMVKEFADRNRLESLEVCAATGDGIQEAFARLALEVYNRGCASSASPRGTEIPPSRSPTPKEGGCC